jgi:hypothetical protein
VARIPSGLSGDLPSPPRGPGRTSVSRRDRSLGWHGSRQGCLGTCPRRRGDLAERLCRGGGDRASRDVLHQGRDLQSAWGLPRYLHRRCTTPAHRSPLRRSGPSARRYRSNGCSEGWQAIGPGCRHNGAGLHGRLSGRLGIRLHLLAAPFPALSSRVPLHAPRIPPHGASWMALPSQEISTSRTLPPRGFPPSLTRVATAACRNRREQGRGPRDSVTLASTRGLRDAASRPYGPDPIYRGRSLHDWPCPPIALCSWSAWRIT